MDMYAFGKLNSAMSIMKNVQSQLGWDDSTFGRSIWDDDNTDWQQVPLQVKVKHVSRYYNFPTKTPTKTTAQSAKDKAEEISELFEEQNQVNEKVEEMWDDLDEETVLKLEEKAAQATRICIEARRRLTLKERKAAAKAAKKKEKEEKQAKETKKDEDEEKKNAGPTAAEMTTINSVVSEATGVHIDPPVPAIPIMTSSSMCAIATNSSTATQSTLPCSPLCN
jgi:hypothetical protein